MSFIDDKIGKTIYFDQASRAKKNAWQTSLDRSKPKRAQKIARTILDGFEKHITLFQDITAGAQDRFEQARWHEVREAARQRIHFYDKRIRETVEILSTELEISSLRQTRLGASQRLLHSIAARPPST